MDIEQLKFTHQKLLAHLESCNYNKVYKGGEDNPCCFVRCKIPNLIL